MKQTFRRACSKGGLQPMAKLKRPLGIDVLTAARQRIEWAFESFSKIYVSFSAGT